MELTYFNNKNFFASLKRFFEQLNIPVNYITQEPALPGELLEHTYKPNNPAHKLMDDVYFLGMVDDAAFENQSDEFQPELKQKTSEDYEGLLIFGVTLNSNNGILPTRRQMAEITRAFNREFHYTPVNVIFKYQHYISFANCERTPYRQKWREGEKPGKVSLLKHVDTQNPHTGHLKILESLKIKQKGKGAVTSFDGLYKYWQEVFSISLLNKNFYRELSNWYFWALQHVEFPDDFEADKEVRNAVNVIRLITRLMFCWFMKEKSLIPDMLFDSEELNAYLNFEDVSNSTYYKAILQNLFFATLNTEMQKDNPKSRKFVNRRYGIQEFYRYDRLFKDKNQALSLFKDIPFLNGGLFENLDKNVGSPDEIRIDCFSNRPDNSKRLKVPDFLFFGDQDELDLSGFYGDKKHKKEVVRGLIHILNSYKFTIAENTPIEEEIALDPELLGKVFENLLASYNPETRTTARKQTGSFYTPREIVNYMVDESLIAYLSNALCSGDASEDLKKDSDDRLHRLLSYSGEQHLFSGSEVEIIINALDTAKILDPACGSGAFPMGVLHKMVHILSKVDPDNAQWRQRQADKVAEIPDPAVRERLLDDIEKSFKGNELDYGRKLYLIQNCIFGVDIQPIAVQIAKLRFFISLVADQKVDQEKKNLGILPLPNLETKFVAANTLIGIERGFGNLFEQDIKRKEEELAKVRERHFSARTPATKAKYRDLDEKLRGELAKLLKESGNFTDDVVAEKLANWDPYDQNVSADFFDMEWMFGVTDGFDIVIGNPPYVQIQKFSEKDEQKVWESQKYKTYTKTGDIYCLFYEKGNLVLRTSGILAYITSNKWMRATYGEKTRKYFLESTNIKQLIDFGDSQIFENATTYTNIIIFEKGKQTSNPLICDINRVYNTNDSLEAMLEKTTLYYSHLFSEDSFVIIPKQQEKIKEKIEKNGSPLKEWNSFIYRGILTGFNESFIITGSKKNELIVNDPKSAEILKPILRGRDIKRYQANYSDLWLIDSHNGYYDEQSDEKVPPINIQEYPIIKKHLDNYWNKLKKRQDRGVTPYNLRNCAYIKEFEKEKIIWLEMSPFPNFTYDSENLYILNTAYILTGLTCDTLKYMLAVLNSSVLDTYFSFIATDVRGKTRRYIKQYVEKLPIPKISLKAQQPFINLVDIILEKKEQGKSIITEEKQIDLMVYKLYDLTHEEVKIIEPEFAMTKEAYEKYNLS
ncbi:MAG: class I SAM-dependent DNA methyltransferase [Desulfobacteraceae bacterium]|nr:class I SAM-dependent DNA methyltransferase [Desulfobacteraceae bacterium]